MSQNNCKKCGNTSLHTEEKGNNIGLYCDVCGAWLTWLNKNELRAFEYSKNKDTQSDSLESEDNIKDKIKSMPLRELLQLVIGRLDVELK